MCLLNLRHLPFPSPFEVRCGEPVGEGERNRPLPLPFFFGSCVKAHESPSEHWPLVIQRVQSPLGVVFFALYFPFPFVFTLLGAPDAGLSSSRFVSVKCESLIFSSRCHWTINFNLQQNHTSFCPDVVS